jgi:hypothetical protein
MFMPGTNELVKEVKTKDEKNKKYDIRAIICH